MITLQSYWMGRDLTHKEELTDEIMASAVVLVERVNDLLISAGRSDVHEIRSGWRPKGINDATSNAAKGSRHITGQAVDLADDDRLLAEWCVDNLDELQAVGLFMEDPRWTPNWVHLQSVPPKSFKTVFIPSSSKPLDPSFPVTWTA